MNDKWLNDVRKSMADYETDEPAELWAGLEKEIARKNPRPSLFARAKRYVAAAAAIVLAFTAGVYILTRQDSITDSPLTADNNNEPSALRTILPALEGSLAEAQTLPGMAGPQGTPAPKTHAQAHVQAYVKAQKPEPTSFITTHCSAEAPAEPENVQRDDSVAVQSSAPQPYAQPENRRRHLTAYTAPKSKGDGGGRLSFAMSTSGGFGALSNHSASPAAFNDGLGPDGAVWEDNPILGILAFNQGKSIKTETSHRLPLKVGMTFTYRLTDRLGIESGLSYAYLASDIREGSSQHYIEGQQALHYVGIPLKLKYKLFSWKKLELYSSVGALAEKCVSAKRINSFVIDNEKSLAETFNLDTKPMQWSVNASAGIQLNIVENLGLYAEPGVSYYFDDGSPLQTIYKEKPFNFNLTFGLRYTL